MRKVTDLTGQKFGKLKVIGRGKDYISPGVNKRQPQWKVECEKCGTKYELGKSSFLVKKNQNCNMHFYGYENLTKQKFGKLIVLGRGKDYISPLGHKSPMWKIRCEECEIEYELSKTSFLKTKNQNCNQHNHRFENLTKQRFGKLTVIKKDEDYISPKHKKKYTKWICKCNCGNTISVLAGHLTNSHVFQCRKCQHKSMQLNGYISSRYFYGIKTGAKKRNLYFDTKIDREYLWNLFLKQNKKCALSNLQIHFSETIRQETSHKGTTASLDRIDNSKGYTKNNIQWTHKHINRIKWKLDQKELLKICKKIWKNQINKKIIIKKYSEKEYTISSSLWNSIKYGAKKRNLYFDPKIDKKYLYELFLKQNKKCKISGINLYLAKVYKFRKKNTASLDRIDSSKGYIPSNIQWINKKINMMKWTFSQDYFIELCGLIANNK